MSGNKTIARPYAKAVFEIAVKDNTLALWSKALELLAQIAEHQSLQMIYRDPRFTPAELSSIFTETVKKSDLFAPEIENLILLLANYRRLDLLPLIALLYEDNRALQEKTLQVSVSASVDLSENITTALKKALEKRLHRKVNLNQIKNTTLIGGLIISVNDLVIDYSVKNRLDKLKNNLLTGLLI